MREVFYNGVDEFREANNNSDKGLDATVTIQRWTTSQFYNSLQTYNWIWTSYTLTTLPGCCGVVVSTNAFVNVNAQGKGLGDYFHKERLELMEELGYSCGLCTVTSENWKEIQILKKNDWKKVHDFLNKRTGNTVEIWVKDI